MTHLSNWREESDLFEVVTGKMTDEKALKKVDEKKGIKNKVVINPKLTEAIKELGGELIEATEEDENGDTVDPRKEAEKKSEEQKKKQIENKQKRAQMIKKQVLMKKLIAVRQGSEDIVAGYKPEGEVIEGYAKPKIPEKLVAKVRVKKSAKVQGKDVKESSAVLDANTKLQKKDDRKKKEAELRRLLNHAIAMKKGRAESVEPEGDIVEGDVHSGQGEKIQKRTLEWMKKKGKKGAPGLDAMKARTAEHKAKRGVKEDWKPEIEHSKLGDAKKKADKKRESSLPPHLQGDAIGKMKKAFATEAVKGQDREARKEMAAERRTKGNPFKKEGDPSKRLTAAQGRRSVKPVNYRKEEVIAEKDLNAAERRALPNKDFALPGKGKGPEGKQAGSYPIPDEKHARSALSLVAQHGTPEEKATVRAKVKKKFPNIDVNEGLGASMAVTAGLNAVGNIAKAYGASQAAKGAIVGGALSGAGALGGGVLNYMASRNNNKKKDDVKPKKTEQKKKEVKEGVMKMVKKVMTKKKPEKKAEKAMDAGARAKRLLARQVHAKYVSGSTDIVPDDIREADDKAYKYVVAQLKKKYGDDAVLTKGQKPKPPTAAQQKKNAEIRAKRAKEDHRDPTEKASDGRYSDRYSNRGSD